MWQNNGDNIEMAEGDFGFSLPITVSGIAFGPSDALRMVVKPFAGGPVLYKKEFTNVLGNVIQVNLTAEESAALKVGTYVYRLDWYRGATLLCNIVKAAKFKVVKKA